MLRIEFAHPNRSISDEYEDESHVAALEHLAASSPIEIAVDSEFEGVETLLIQAAVRVGKDLIVQLYRSKSIPLPPAHFNSELFLDAKLGEHYDRVVLRPVKTIHAALSPTEILLDLTGLSGLPTFRRDERHLIWPRELGDLFEPRNVEWKKESQWNIPEMALRFGGHFLPADLGRLFGVDYCHKLIARSQK